MGVSSAIEWTAATWNPWRGCDKVSPGCAHCYMFTEQRRYGHDPAIVVRCSDSTLQAPVRSKKWLELPAGSHVFTCSWSDFFHPDADAWRDEAWAVIASRVDLTWQILTKRPERILDCLPTPARTGGRVWGAHGWPNVWLGVSIENRRYVDRADLLREVPAAVRFISAEPLLGPLLFDSSATHTDGRERPAWQEEYLCWSDDFEGVQLDLTGIAWLIAGGESGPKARPMLLDWARDLRDACADAGTHFFLKQLGGRGNKRAGERAVLDGQRWVEMPGSRRAA